MTDEHRPEEEGGAPEGQQPIMVGGMRMEAVVLSQPTPEGDGVQIHLRIMPHISEPAKYCIFIAQLALEMAQREFAREEQQKAGRKIQMPRVVLPGNVVDLRGGRDGRVQRPPGARRGKGRG